MHVFAGLALGWFLGTITSAGVSMKRLIMVCIAFQDTTAIPLIFAAVLGGGDLPGKEKNFKTDAISYVLIYTVFVTVYKWTLAYG